MRIQNNIMAINAYRNYNNNTSALSKNLEKLSSGYRINRAGDDAAGLAISEKMRAQITGLDAAQKNVKDGISLVKTAEGAMQEIQDMLNRVKYLATQSANGTYQDDVDRDALQDELNALTSEIDRIADSANFNGQKLLDGTLGNKPTSTAIATTATGAQGTAAAVYTIDFAGLAKATEAGKATVTIGGKSYELTIAKDDDAAKIAAKFVTAFNNDKISGTNAGAFTAADINNGKVTLTAAQQAVDDSALATAKSFSVAADYAADGVGLSLQIGDDGKAYNQISVSIQSMKAADLGVTGLDISNKANAQAAIDGVVDIINSVSSTRGKLGAIQNRLEHTNNNLSVMAENIQDAESNIRDTDVADEMMAYTKNNILIQSAQAMLAQANTIPQGVLQLLG